MTDIDDIVAKKLVEELQKPTFNGGVRWDSDVEGMPGWIIQQVVHTIRPHREGEGIDPAEERADCPACNYRWNVEPRLEQERAEAYERWLDARPGRRAMYEEVERLKKERPWNVQS